MASNAVFTVKACNVDAFKSWKAGKSVFLVKDQCFAPLTMTQERLDYLEDCYPSLGISTPFEELSMQEKIEAYILLLDKEERLPVTYDEYLDHPHIEPIYESDIVLFNVHDNFLDENDNVFITGRNTVNMSKVMRLMDQKHKYTRDEMINIYNAIYPFLKRDEEGENENQKEN